MMDSSEIWRPIPAYEGRYEISSLGRLRSLRGKGRLLKPQNNKGYCQITLSKEGKATHHYLQRLVAEVFLGSRPEGKECHHRNGIKTDNRAVNLAYVTHAENIQLAYAMGFLSRRGSKNCLAKLSERQVTEILCHVANCGASAKELAPLYGMSVRAVECILEGRSWGHVTL